MAKMTRERAVQERRALKQQKKEARKQAALEAREPGSANGTPSEETVGDEVRTDEPSTTA